MIALGRPGPITPGRRCTPGDTTAVRNGSTGSCTLLASTGVHPMSLLSAAVVFATALFLLALGVTALAAPDAAGDFLRGFAQTLRVHFVELGLRVVAGAALIMHAPSMAGTPLFTALGWMLVATGVVLLALPWRWHQRFAAWSVPRAVAHPALIGVGALAMAGALLVGLALGSPPAR